MVATVPGETNGSVLDLPQLDLLIHRLASRGYEVVGPTIRDNAIVYDTLTSVDDLPKGWTDVQSNGCYALKHRADEALFGYAVGPHSWKKFLRPSAQRLWSAEQTVAGFQIIPERKAPPRYALFGVRACELSAMAIQDKVLRQGPYVDPGYSSQRESLFIVAVQCSHAGGTCFCASMGAGPEVESGYDLVLTEILEHSRHYFLVQAGTERGAEMLSDLPHAPAGDTERAAAARVVAEACRSMGRELDTRGLAEILDRNHQHPRWDHAASRCLSCANCTMVCPTCFCTTVEDVTDLTGQRAERWKKWDSCFTVDFSYIHGGSVRTTTRSRYRQWMTHKLGTWMAQFGTPGCVGCGRCITWCPVGIDLTEEARSIRQSDSAHGGAHSGGDRDGADT